MKKNFAVLLKHFSTKAHAIIWLGDIFDSGRYLQDDKFHVEYERFRNIAPISKFGNIIELFIPGNHDVGYGDKMYPILERYEKYFGKLNYHREINGVDVIGVNAPYLEESFISAKADAWKFIKNWKNRGNPTILLTHVPLFRPDNAECKFKRRRPMKQGYGLGYRNMLNPSVSKSLIEYIRPNRVFSGDDHLQCEHLHEEFGVIENTVGTFSWLQGEIYPSFGIFSIWKDKNGNIESEYKMCSLPPQMLIYIWYAILGFISILVILIYPLFISICDGILFWRNYKSEPQALEEGRGIEGDKDDQKRKCTVIGLALWRGVKPVFITAGCGITFYALLIFYWHL